MRLLDLRIITCGGLPAHLFDAAISALEKTRNGRSIGLLDDSFFGRQDIDQMRRGNVEYGIEYAYAGCGHRAAGKMGKLRCVSMFN